MDGASAGLACAPPSTNQTPTVAGRSDQYQKSWHGYFDSPHYQNKLSGLAAAASARGWYAVLPFGTAPVPTETCCPVDCDVECCTSGRGSSATPEESCAVVWCVNVQCMLKHASPRPLQV